MARKRPPKHRAEKVRQPLNAPTMLRVIGGEMGGRGFRYNGDAGLRPMKDRVREAVFNLIGPTAQGKVVIDLFGGTGAMAFEAISRGAVSARVIERRFPNAKMITENAESLGIADRVEVQAGDTFIAYKQLAPPAVPALIFCCPPYDFYVERAEETLALITKMCEIAPPFSLILVESDARFDPSLLPNAEAWDVRTYSPAVIALYEKPESSN
ncbi:MAG TPA: RsmD family RNA methyltransferase [Pirellulaceae bacterium]|nr:RsmD family RNA methyltransferase [Planctomycetales bacterium]MCB9940020.1 RsmD family RNA methyltransferase [Planctomycetaceae bacterium]HRX79582.1 RsmD family RNA methyltransferase [Pirellulaceae bacterium]